MCTGRQWPFKKLRILRTVKAQGRTCVFHGTALRAVAAADSRNAVDSLKRARVYTTFCVKYFTRSVFRNRSRNRRLRFSFGHSGRDIGLIAGRPDAVYDMPKLKIGLYDRGETHAWDRRRKLTVINIIMEFGSHLWNSIRPVRRRITVLWKRTEFVCARPFE